MVIPAALLSLAISGALASPLSTSTHNPRQQSTLALAPVFRLPAEHAHNAINNSYIVVLKPQAAVAQHINFVQNVHASSSLLGAGLKHVYHGHLKGYSGHFSEDTIQLIRAQPEVDYVEEDQMVYAYDIKRQNSAPWGLARISHRGKLGFRTFNKYEYDPEGGLGVDAYVIDTGVNIAHKEFEGRATWGKTMPTDASDSDGNGHGTHCAGTIASRAYGVAKAANIIAVKVLGDNGSGSMSDVVGGVVWASDAAAARLAAARDELQKTGKTSHRGSVANMSLGGGKSRALDDAVNAAVDAGMHFAVAAGNDNRDACNYSPAAAEKAVTVGASTLQDERASFSNHGKCVDVFAPGQNILSTWTGSDDARNTISGTSMASPHTAGLLAYYLSLYPSNRATFDRLAASAAEPEAADLFYAANSIYRIAHASLPSWLGAFVPGMLRRTPVPAEEVAPIPTISPAKLKAALIALSTKDALSGLPAETVNLLIFNNATTEAY